MQQNRSDYPKEISRLSNPEISQIEANAWMDVTLKQMIKAFPRPSDFPESVQYTVNFVMVRTVKAVSDFLADPALGDTSMLLAMMAPKLCEEIYNFVLYGVLGGYYWGTEVAEWPSREEWIALLLENKRQIDEYQPDQSEGE